MKIPQYENPVFLGCTSRENADISVEIGYFDYSSSLFYVGECGTDAYAALVVVVEYLVEQGIIEAYTGDEDMISEYPEDYIEVEGYSLPSWRVIVHQL